MPIAGNARWVFPYQVVGGELVVGKQQMSLLCETDLDTIVDKLGRGEVVNVSAVFPLPSQVTAAVQAMLQGEGMA